MDSIEYYNENSTEYYDQTINIDMQDELDRFIALIPEGGAVLDLGCGSGRDSAYFISHGFDMTALDASVEMCNLASIQIGQDVLCLSFAEMDFHEVFDGVWACASLLHVPRNDMEDIMSKVIASIKRKGILYMSFYYGDFEGIRNHRYYTDYHTKAIKELLAKFNNLELIEIKKTEDRRPGKDHIWINAMVRKV